MRYGLGLGLSVWNSNYLYPSMSLDFLSGSLDPKVTFKRASTATYIGSDGLLKTAAVDQPRFDYDPITLACKGLLIEGTRTNYFTNSSDAVSAWGIKSNITVQSDVETAPDGYVTADAITENTSLADHYIERSTTLAANQLVTYAVFIKPKGNYRDIWLYLYANGYTDSIRAGFNTTTLSITTTGAGGTGALANASIKAYPNGWYRLLITGQVSTAVVTDMKPRLSFVNGSTSYTGDGTSGLFIWGAQIEAGPFATSYIPTGASSVTRAGDSAVMTGVNFSNWFNPVEGTFSIEFSGIGYISGASRRAVEFAQTGSTAERIFAGYSSLVSSRVFVVDNNVTQADILADMVSPENINRIAAAYAANNLAQATNGAAAVVDTAGTIPTVDRVAFGSEASGALENNALFGHIRRFRYFRSRLSNTRLQELST